MILEIVAATRVPCRDLSDRWICATVARSLASRHGLDRRACADVALAAAELASNAVRHGGGGEIEVRALVSGARRGVEIVCRDAGGGIDDVESALRDGWSRGRARVPDDEWRDGLGAGLGSVRRAMTELEITSGPGRGTRIAARRWAS